MSFFIKFSGVKEGDFQGFNARIQSKQIKDSLMIGRVKSSSTLCFLLKDQSKDVTLLEEYLRAGEGVLFIKASRISFQRQDDPRILKNYKHKAKAGILVGEQKDNSSGEVQSLYDGTGRFPSNFILQHHPECRREGTREIGTGPLGGYSYTTKSYAVEGFVATCNPSSPSNRGREKIDNWICVKECPIPDLETKKSESNWKEAISGCVSRLDNAGRASRYFYQSSSDKDITNYLSLLIGKDLCQII